MSQTNSLSKKVVIIGAGFSSLSAACYLANAGFDVTVVEKNEYSGGRARQLKKDGFTFDMGPTFYWMPDVFEKFFSDFKRSVSDFYQLEKLNPAYTVYFEDDSQISIADNINDIFKTFESNEKGSSKQLAKFLKVAEDNYNIAVKDLVYKPGESLSEIITPTTITKLSAFVDTIKKQVGRQFKNNKLKKILEFPVLFLGAKPSTTPSFYNFMNHADFNLGTWHPKGGMFEVAQAIHSLAIDLGVKFKYNSPVQSINIHDKQVKSVTSKHENIECDILLSGADYHHTEKLLPNELRQYSEAYWGKKTFAPSSLLFYVGFDKKIDNVDHHTLFFDVDFEAHAESIYDTKEWPSEPLFYASFPSKTDDTCAPLEKEAGIFLIPLAPGIEDTQVIRDQYFEIILSRLEKRTKQNIRSHVLFKESYCINDFVSDYNSYKGNAYGLANTLTQTHVLRPKLKSKKVKNLYFTGQLTVPGPGVPPSLISGKVVSTLINKYH
ncbi:phytoene desaturase family protein [Carboxylicivirga sp. N1Y90]|uniref:phytoene desaturase family protein n=1 Tax=Carboxylicivirga fragile TaxID=3417571 RepID=UPI003D33BCC1|nr:phytoene desaturase [Marinilabiliaceae bacterium N1Y90]